MKSTARIERPVPVPVPQPAPVVILHLEMSMEEARHLRELTTYTHHILDGAEKEHEKEPENGYKRDVLRSVIDAIKGSLRLAGVEYFCPVTKN